MEVADSAPAPIVRGRDLIALGLRPGETFGGILKACYEAQLDGVFRDLAGGVKYVRGMIEDIYRTKDKTTNEGAENGRADSGA